MQCGCSASPVGEYISSKKVICCLLSCVVLFSVVSCHVYVNTHVGIGFLFVFYCTELYESNVITYIKAEEEKLILY